MSDPVVRVGLLGCGVVGGALVGLIDEECDTIAARTGIRLDVVRIAVRDVGRVRDLPLAPGVFTSDCDAVAGGGDVDIMVEVMGGIEPARTLILEALGGGTPVVTANKELLAAHGPELLAAADVAGVDLLFEAAVGGGIPIIRPVRESLLGEPVHRIMGIVNGTTNYILTRMTEDGASYDDALDEAQRLGFAESDPTADVEGHDAAAKIAILAAIAFGARVTSADVSVEGISNITADDITYATRKHLVIKLLAIAERVSESGQSGPSGNPIELRLRVHPVLLPATHPLASVRESFNAVFVEGEAVGELMFYGRGAGGRPTASAVLGDLIDAARNQRTGGAGSVGTLAQVDVRSLDDLCCAYFVALDVTDRPGVLAAVAGMFGTHGVSIASMEQEGRGDGARLAFVTHTARERDLRATLADLHELDAVQQVGSVIRLLVGDDGGSTE